MPHSATQPAPRSLVPHENAGRGAASCSLACPSETAQQRARRVIQRAAGSHLLAHQRPDLVQVDDGAVEVVLQLVEGAHANLEAPVRVSLRPLSKTLI